jgi:hypothetical protein
MSDNVIDYEKLVSEMRRQDVFRKEPDLTPGMKIGIALGGMSASTVTVVNAIPVIGHVSRFVGDVGTGCRMGYRVKMAQIEQEMQAKKELMELQQAQLRQQMEKSAAPA